jgi:pyridoxal phosphate enzyme (YggS family)
MLLEKNYLEVKEKIRDTCNRVGRNINEINIVAVSKSVSFSKIMELNKAGQIDFGENRVKELKEKHYNNTFQYPGKINWHLVGHLQSNKVTDIIGFIYLIHSLDSYKLAEEINTNAKKINKIINVLVQVNTTNEPQKSGVSVDEAINLCKQISIFENVGVKGLMTIAKQTEVKENIRESFKTLKGLYDELKPGMKDFEYLSMGMSNDFDIAIEEGSNMIRIGSALFGESSS